MKKNILFLLILALATTFASCKKGNDSPLLSETEKSLTAVQPWKSAGIFSNGVLVPGTNSFKYEVSFLSTGIPGAPGDLKVNGITIPASWSWSAGNSRLTFNYFAGYGSGTGLAIGNFTGQINISSAQLEFIAPATGEANLFGLINIPAGNTLRFTSTGDVAAAPGSNTSALYGVYLAQLYTATGLGGAGTGTISGNPFSMNFKNFIGINSLLVDTAPVPSTWALAADNITLTFNYPVSASINQAAGTSQFLVVGSIPAAIGGKFRIKNLNPTTTITIYGVFKLAPSEELELTRQQ